MLEAGCQQIDDMTGQSAMLLSAVRLVGRAWSILRKAAQTVREGAFDAAVVIDSPALHLPMAARFHQAGLPVLYYVAPQLWAWNPRRIHRLRRHVRRLAVVLPFEEAYFRSRGMDATFVGHPLFDRLRQAPPDPQAVDAIRAAGRPVVALLPGSRRHVVREVLPGQIEVARAIARAFPAATFGVSVANPTCAEIVRGELQRATRASPAIDMARYEHGHAELIAAADLVLVASGTSTLEVAYLGKPMIVMYNASGWLVRRLGRRLVRTRHLSLPNILAEAEIVPEFMPYYRDTSPIAVCAVEILRDVARGQRMAADLTRAVAPLARPGAARHAAQLLFEMIEE